jgi:CheY-like chemotaxis protein
LVSVTDDGEGIPKEVIERVFEQFFTTKEVGKGSGLGLSMVYGFVKQPNGHVSIYSEPGLGTTTRISLPQGALKSVRPLAQSPTDNDSLPNGAETVMIVEDDPFVRSYAVMRLESLGYSAVAAVDGADALQKLRADIHIDILFTDIVMPGGINGWELADLARQLRPGLPVLLTSGYALETLAKHGRLRAGAIVLAKPYRKADLARRLREVVSVSEIRSRSRADASATIAALPCGPYRMLTGLALCKVFDRYPKRPHHYQTFQWTPSLSQAFRISNVWCNCPDVEMIHLFGSNPVRGSAVFPASIAHPPSPFGPTHAVSGRSRPDC